MRYLSRIILLMLTGIAFNSCKHDNFEEYVGPALCPTANFSIIEPFDVSLPNIDFTKVSGAFGDALTAKFSEEVTWKIELNGTTSGAQKVFRGRSAVIDTVWFGQSNDPAKFFQTGEDVTVTLSVSCLSTTYTKNIHIDGASRFDLATSPFIMVSDFDGVGYVANTVKLPGYNGTGWSSYFTPSSGTLTTFQIGESVSALSAAQGSKYLTLKGTAAPTSWFVGGMYINPPVSFPSSNPNDLYFNAFIGSGNNLTTTLSITLKVSDSEKYNYVLPLKWSGWKMVSLKFSDFKDKLGSSIENPGTITAFDFGLNCATLQGQSTEVDLDFVVISAGGPFFQ